MPALFESTLSRFGKWWSSAVGKDPQRARLALDSQSAPAVFATSAQLDSHGPRGAGVSFAALGGGLRVLREGLRIVALCALGSGIGYWLMELRSDLRTLSKAIASVSHTPGRAPETPVLLVDRLQSVGEELAAPSTDALSERDLFKCLAGAEEVPQRAQGRLLCYRVEMERLQEALRDEYSVLLVLSPIEQQGRIVTSQQQWEADLASRCAPNLNNHDPGFFSAEFRCRIDAIRIRIKGLREIA